MELSDWLLFDSEHVGVYLFSLLLRNFAYRAAEISVEIWICIWIELIFRLWLQLRRRRNGKIVID